MPRLRILVPSAPRPNVHPEAQVLVEDGGLPSLSSCIWSRLQLLLRCSWRWAQECPGCTPTLGHLAVQHVFTCDPAHAPCRTGKFILVFPKTAVRGHIAVYTSG